MSKKILVDEEVLNNALEALIEASRYVNNEVFVKVMMARDAVADVVRKELIKKQKVLDKK
jgi:hypothetical protein